MTATAPTPAPASPTPATRAPRTSPLTTALAQLSSAVELLGYDDGLHQMLATPRRELHVAVPLRATHLR